MKKLIVTTLLSCIFLFTHAQKVIEWPEFKGTTASYLKILKIELHDTATLIDFRVRYVPGYWIQVSDDTWIQDSEGGEKLFVKNGKGIKINEQHITPENGLNEYTLIFPAVGKDVKSIDYLGSDWKIFGIEIAPNENFSIFPKALIGNWLQTDGSNLWDVGFYENLAIYEGEIWKQVLVNSSENAFHILLQKENIKKKLVAKLQGDNLLIGPDESNMKLLSKEFTTNHEYSIPNNNEFQLPIFKKDTAFYTGYIKGYDSRMGQTGMVYANNILTSRQESFLIEVNDDGTFSASIPMLYPQLVYVRFMGKTENIYLEPGETTFQFFDLSKYNDAPGPGSLFMGATARINKDMIGLRSIRYFDFQDLQEIVLDMSPEEYKQYFLNIKNKEQKALQEYIQNNSVSKKAEQIKNMQIFYDNAKNTLSYNRNRAMAYRQKHNVPRDQREIPLEQVELDKAFYDFITPGQINNPLAIITGGEYFSFLNRLNYAGPVQFTGSFYNLNITATDFEKRGIKLEPEMKELVNGLAKCKTKEERKKFLEKDSILSQEFTNKYNDLHREISLTRWYKLKAQERKEGFREYFGFGSGFAIDILKAQDVMHQMNSTTQPLSETEKSDLKDEIENSFIVDYLLHKNDELEKKVGGKKEASISETEFVVNKTPNAKNDDLFDAIIKKYEGNLVFADFWATWCGPCRVGIKRMKPLKEELKNEKIKFIYLTNPTSPKKTWETMLPDIPGEHYYLTEDEWNLLAARFKVSGIPHYVLVGKDGSVIKHGVYFASSNAELKKIFNEYLN